MDRLWGGPHALTDRPDPFRSSSCELLAVLADEGRPMSLRDLERDSRLTATAARQLSVARVAGFVRTMPAVVGGAALEPRYQPSPLGLLIARRSRAVAAAQEERRRLYAA